MKADERRAYDQAPALLRSEAAAGPAPALLPRCARGADAQAATGIPAPDKPFPGETVSDALRFVASAAMENTRTFGTGSKVPNSDDWLGDGMSAVMRIPASGEPVHMLSGSALTLDDAGPAGGGIVKGGDMARFGPIAIFVHEQGETRGGLRREATTAQVGKAQQRP